MVRALVRRKDNTLVLTLTAVLLAAALAWGLTTEPAGARGAGVLAAPTGLTVNDATQIQFTLTWNAVAGAADYQVKRGEDGEVTTVTSTSHRFWGPNAGTAYTLYVRARNAQGVASDWASTSASTLAPGLASPTNVTATVSSPTDVTLSWDAVPGAVFYSVWSSGASGANTNDTSYTVTGLSANASHYVSVRAWAGEEDDPDVSFWVTRTATMPALPSPPPPVPSGLTVSDATQIQFTLSWNAVAGAADYQVRRDAAGAISAVTGTSHRFWGSNAGTAYTLYVRARNAQGVASAWATASASTLAPVLAAPTNVTATGNGSTGVTLSWDAVPGAASYSVWSSGAPGGDTTNTSYTISGLSANASHIVTVRAQAGQSDNPDVSPWVTRTVTIPALPAPTGLGAAAAGASLTLRWSAVAGATSYEVKQGASGTATAVSSGTSHSFSGLTANTAYTLYVRAANSSGSSDWSSLSATTAPAAPSGLSASANSTTITLSWSAVSGATGYDVRLGATGAATSVPSGASYSFGGLTAGLDYTLSVRAKNADGASGWSSTTASIPTPNDGLSVIAATPDSITVAWSAVTGATSYEVKAGADGAITAVTSGRSYEFTGLLPSMDESANIALPYHQGMFGNDRTLYVRGKNATQAFFPWRLITARTAGFLYPGYPPISASSTSITIPSAGSQAVRFKLGPSGAVATVLPTLGRRDPFLPYPPNPPAQTSTHTFTGLAPATTYTIAEDNGVYTLHASPASPTGPGPVVTAATVAKQWSWSGTSRWGTFTTAPAAPSGLRATPNSNGLTLSWNAVTGATRYDVKLGADGPATTVPAAATSYTFTGLAPSTPYRLYVHARNGGGSSEWKSRTETTLSTLTPPPSGLTVTDATPPTSLGLPRITPASLTLSWDAVSGATSYEVKRSPGSETPTAVTGTSYTFPNLTADTEYTLSVRGKAGAVTFPWRSIIAKTEAAKWETGVGSSLLPIYVVPTSTSLTVLTAFSTSSQVSSVGSIEVKLNKSESPTTEVCCDRSPVRHFYNSFTFAGLTADTEYTIYVRSRRSPAWSAWRSITAKTLPAQFSGIRTTSFGQPGVAFHGSGTIRIGGGVWPLLWAWSSPVTPTPTDRYFSEVMVGEEAAEFTYYLRSTVSGDADPPVYQWTQYTATTAPWHPNRLSATATSASLTLRWAVVPGATGYRVKLGESGTTTTVTGASHEFPDLTANTEYTLYVYAENRGGNSEWSSITASTTTTPPAPANLSATATSTTITLSWNAVTGATGYDVKQGASGTATAVSSGASYTFTGLTAGTEYTLYVRARNSGGNSEWNLLTTSTTTVPSAPNAPSKGSVTDTTIALSWNSIVDAAGYDVKIATAGVDDRVESVPTASGVGHTASGLTANTEYTLSVRARNSSGASPWSPTLKVTTAPPAPTNLRKRAASDKTIDLDWNAVTGVTGYEVKIAAAGKVDRVETVSLAEGLSYTIDSLDANTEYSLSMRSKNSNGSSGWSTALKVTTASPTPAGLRKTSATDTIISLTWNAAAAATGYDVKIVVAGVDDREEVVPSTSGVSHTVSGLTPNTEYTLFVRSKNSNGASLWSTGGTAIKVTTAPPAPSNFSAAATSTSLTLRWNAAAGAAGYDVKQGASGTETAVSSGTSHTFDSLISNTEYTLYVRAKNSSSASEWSSLTARTMPTPPSGLSATATSTSLTLTWNAVAEATSYEVKRGADGLAVIIAADTSLTFSLIFGSLTAGTEYTLYIRSKNGRGASDWSSISASTSSP